VFRSTDVRQRQALDPGPYPSSWIMITHVYPVALHVNRFSRKAAQSCQRRENGQAMRQGRPPVQYHIGKTYRLFDPDIDTFFLDAPANDTANIKQIQRFIADSRNALRCRTVKHLALNIDSIHFWITAERKVKPGIKRVFMALEHISIVLNWPSWPDPSVRTPVSGVSAAVLRRDVFWARSPLSNALYQIAGARSAHSVWRSSTEGSAA
jgi:hypothetical protein